MREKIEAVIEELKLLKAGGATSVHVEPESIAQLAAALKPVSAERIEVAASASSTQVNVAEPAPKRSRFKREIPVIDLGMAVDTPAQVSKKSPTSSNATPQKREYLSAPIPEPPVVELPVGDKQTQWEWLKQRVLECPVCNEHVPKDRGKQVVFGVGNLDADILFCGEAPGAEEETQGEPFVGPAGQLLTKIITAMGLKREQVYISNIMNWRPEMPTAYGNRKPYPEEMAYCLPYLKAQLAIVQPKVVVALGGTAVDGLLGADSKRRMGQVRGKWNTFGETPLMITFHPSYLLRNNTLRTKRMVWEDMMLVMEKIALPISDKQRNFFLK